MEIFTSVRITFVVINQGGRGTDRDSVTIYNKPLFTVSFQIDLN